MAGRALVFSNPAVVSLLKTQFVPYAGDQWYLHRQQDANGAYFWKVVQQGYRKDRPTEETRQGVYAATADGMLLGSLNQPRTPEPTIVMLRQAVERWKQMPRAERTETSALPADTQYARTPPAGGVILNVFTRIPLAPPAGEVWTPNQATGRDHMWLTREEWRALLPAEWRTGARYPMPPAVAARLVRFHLVDNVRGEPDMWRPAEIREAELTLIVEDAAAGRLRLEGSVRMQAPTNGRASDRGYDARIQGNLTYDRKAGHFKAFDLLAWGEAWGQGTYTGGAPPGRFPLVIAFSLAGDRPTDRVPPQGSRLREEYFGTLRAAR